MSKLLDELRAREAAKKAAEQPVVEPVKEDPAAAAKVITDGIADRVLKAYEADETYLDVMELPEGDIDFDKCQIPGPPLHDGDCVKPGTVVALVNEWCKAEGYERRLVLRGPAVLHRHKDHKWWLVIRGWKS